MFEMPRMFMMVGLPASGKSTAAEILGRDYEAVIISSDRIRYELYGSEETQGNPATVFSKVKERAVAALCEGYNVVIDATNVSAKKRTSFLAEISRRVNVPFKKICVAMMTPYDSCVERDAARKRTVGRPIIDKMIRQFEVPFYNEGWDEIALIYDDEDLIGGQHLCDEMAGFDQKNPHHTLDLYQHCLAAADKCYGEDCYIAAYWHDVGKLYTQCFDGEGVAHYYSHEKVSCYTFLTSTVAYDMREIHNTNKVLRIAFLICWHMQPYFSKSKEAFHDWCLKKGINILIENEIWHLHEADKAAH